MDTTATKKLLNVYVANASRRLGLNRTLGRPFCMTLDPCTLCNLNCPLCIQGSQKGNFEQCVFDFSLYQKVMKHYGPWLTHLGLYSWGEPFLNKRIYDMIALAKRYDIEVTISTNLNVGDPQKIVDSGLDYLACSLDGATQETYAKYRVGGDLDAALDRAKEIVRLRKERGAGTPSLTWQFLLFEHNAHEVEAARALADEIGFDSFVTQPGFVHIDHPVIKPIGGTLSTAAARPQREPAGRKKGKSGKGRRRFLNTKDQACAWLYSCITLDPAGNVYPCCLFWKESHSFASIDGAGIDGIYNSEKFQKYRRYMAARGRGKAPAKPNGAGGKGEQAEPHPCEICGRFSETSFSYDALRRYFEARIKLAKPLKKLLKELMK